MYPRSAPRLLVPVVALVVLLGCGKAPATITPDAGSVVDSGPAQPPPPFTITAYDNARIYSHSNFPDGGPNPNFQKVEAEIDWGTAAKEQVVLSVQLESTCFPFEKWATNPPPQGQNWPADCDAFDRNFSFILDPSKTQTDPPGFELVRAITPFGGPKYFEVDLTDLANAKPGKHLLRATISTWSDGAGQVSGSNGGWNVTALVYVKPGTPPRNVLSAISLFDGNHGTTGPGPELTFQVPAGATSTRLEYRATGHGGGTPDSACIGPAEEFCQRTHTLFADGTEARVFSPWRDDCHNFCTQVTAPGPGGGNFTYCLENPCGAIQSVNAPRANWCPGAITDAEVVEPAAWQTPGQHTFRWSVDKVQSGGSWRTSATVYSYGP